MVTSMIEQNISVTADTKAIWLIFSGERILQSTENPGLLLDTWAALDFAHHH